MDLKNLFNEIQIPVSIEEATNKEKIEIKKIIKDFFKNDTTYMKLKKKAVKSSDAVPDFIDYIYNSFGKEIDKMSNKYNIDYNELAQLAISM